MYQPKYPISKWRNDIQLFFHILNNCLFIAQLVKQNEIISETKKSMKLWQIALAIGIPSAAILAYFLYKRQQRQSAVQKLKSQAVESRLYLIKATQP